VSTREHGIRQDDVAGTVSGSGWQGLEEHSKLLLILALTHPGDYERASSMARAVWSPMPGRTWE
jgi:hypothetical protein